MSYEGAISSMGKTRDDDGTVDRVADPPQKLWAVLAAFKYKCEVENIELVSIFEVRTIYPRSAKHIFMAVSARFRARRTRRRAAATTLAS